MKKRVFKLIVCICIVYCLLTCFSRIKSAVENAVNIWVNVIVPSVFPYMVLAKYISGSDILNLFEVFPGKIISKVFRLSGCSVKPFLCSLFCGYPSGAICASDLYNRKMIHKDEAKRLICFTNNAGPLFLISAVGRGMLGSFEKGIVIYFIHIVSAMIYGFFCSIGKKVKSQLNSDSNKYTADICLSIKYAVDATVNICGFMIAAYVISECFIILTDKIVLFSPHKEYIEFFIRGTFEISAGVTYAGRLNIPGFKFAFVCALVSWSGISVIMQIKSVAGNIITTKEIIKSKLCQAILSFCMGYIAEYLLNNKTDYIPSKDYSLILSLIFSVILFSYYLYNKKKKLPD
ncbi:MAG: hypothetical protein IKJ68_00945 [Clostridia bacterium]|nr:hypothetical protein [Clostridia bacterium]